MRRLSFHSLRKSPLRRKRLVESVKVARDLIHGRTSARVRPAVLAAVYIIVLVWSSLGATYDGTVPSASAQGGRDGLLATIRIAGNEFRIPRNYFQGTMPRDAEREGFFIRALMPHMDPMQAENKNAFLYARRFGSTVNILGHDQHATTTLQFRLNTARELGTPYADREERYGLNAYLLKESESTQARRRREIYVDEQGASLPDTLDALRRATYHSPRAIMSSSIEICY